MNFKMRRKDLKKKKKWQIEMNHRCDILCTEATQNTARATSEITCVTHHALCVGKKDARKERKREKPVCGLILDQ